MYFSELAIDAKQEAINSKDYQVWELEQDGWKRDGCVQELSRSVFYKQTGNTIQFKTLKK